MIFLDFNLPNATTWFYLSALLAVALFFKFSRFLSVRNWDVVALFLLVPGLLLLREPGGEPLAYVWLFAGSAYFLGRCLLDLTLVQRPALAPNLTLGGLAWLAGALFICLVAVAVTRRSDNDADGPGKDPDLTKAAANRAADLVDAQVQANNGPAFDARLWVRRSLAILCHLAIFAGLVVVGRRHFHDLHGGMAAGTFYLLLPYTAFHVDQWHYVWPMALVVWAVVFYRKPALAGLLLGLAAGTVYFPLLILPVWGSFYRGRGTGRFFGSFALALGLCLAATGLILWYDNALAHSLQSLRTLPAWQPWLPPRGTRGFWTGMEWAWAYRMPVFVACMALTVTTAFWPSPKNLAHVLALSAAALIGVQFWYADQGGVYVLWYLPLLLLIVFRPNLSDHRPLPINPENDWLFRLGRLALRVAARVVRLPETPVPQR
ncbi:MAG TPA: hypothetical protein VKA46_00910 [Gemmataceae bacterium]|nr:hypothetical protein [Gemmataceae bacterium]